MKKLLAIILFCLGLAGSSSSAQTTSPYLYKFQFSGTAYQTNAVGTIVGTHITDQTLLADRARLGNITDLSTISLVYHINGNSLGDTIEVISNATGQVLTTELGLYYGSEGSLGRTAVTNATQTQQRRVDYIYTFDNSTYTSPNSHSSGAAFTYKSFVTQNGATNAVINGSMSWEAGPYSETNTGPIVCVGTFSLGAPIVIP